MKSDRQSQTIWEAKGVHVVVILRRTESMRHESLSYCVFRCIPINRDMISGSLDAERADISIKIKDKMEKGKELSTLLSDIISNAFELDETGKIQPDSQIIRGAWMHPKWGCDTIDHMLDDFQNILQDIIFNKDAILTVNILRHWDREKIENFAKHLLGDKCQVCEK